VLFGLGGKFNRLHNASLAALPVSATLYYYVCMMMMMMMMTFLLSVFQATKQVFVTKY